MLDEKDPRIDNSKLNTNGAIPFTVLNVFPYGTVEVNHSQFDTFKVNITRLRLYLIIELIVRKRSLNFMIYRDHANER